MGLHQWKASVWQFASSGSEHCTWNAFNDLNALNAQNALNALGPVVHSIGTPQSLPVRFIISSVHDQFGSPLVGCYVPSTEH